MQYRIHYQWKISRSGETDSMYIKDLDYNNFKLYKHVDWYDNGTKISADNFNYTIACCIKKTMDIKHSHEMDNIRIEIHESNE